MAKAKATKEVLSEEQVNVLASFHLSVQTGDLAQKLLMMVDEVDERYDYAADLSAEMMEISNRLWELSWEFKKVVTGVGDPYEESRDRATRGGE